MGFHYWSPCLGVMKQALVAEPISRVVHLLSLYPPTGIVVMLVNALASSTTRIGWGFSEGACLLLIQLLRSFRTFWREPCWRRHSTGDYFGFRSLSLLLFSLFPVFRWNVTSHSASWLLGLLQAHDSSLCLLCWDGLQTVPRTVSQNKPFLPIVVVAVVGLLSQQEKISNTMTFWNYIKSKYPYMCQ